jgi:3'(2'), 5'-bisphosphate nucleotidase
MIHSRRNGRNDRSGIAVTAKSVSSQFDTGRRAEIAYALRDIAREAGDCILRVYNTDFAARAKLDHSPVTAADEAAEQIILARLAKLAPSIPAIAEESVAAGQVPDIGAGPFWLVDPLDGTREFINRNGEFTVNIALIEHGRPILGVVHIPAQARLYVASAPGEVFCFADKGGSKRIAARQPGKDGLVVVASRSHRDAETDNYLGTLKIKDFLAAGSSLKFCRLAEGTADLYPRFGRTMEWDTAAGHAVLAAAGGIVRALDGSELTYGKPGFENPAFIARGRSD